MAKESIAEFEPGVSRVLTSKGETSAHFYNKIAKVYDLLAERSEMPMREAGLKSSPFRPAKGSWELASAQVTA